MADEGRQGLSHVLALERVAGAACRGAPGCGMRAWSRVARSTRGNAAAVDRRWVCRAPEAVRAGAGECAGAARTCGMAPRSVFLPRCTALSARVPVPRRLWPRERNRTAFTVI